MHNIEKSAFQKGQYVGYGGGAVWHIRNYGKGNWRATPQGNNSHKVFTCATLRDVSTQLETLNAPKAKGETFAELVRQNPAPRKYRGKYPRNIKEIYSARVRGAHGVIVILNDGSRHEITAGDTKGVPPALNENFDAFMAQVSAPGFEPPSVRAARGDPEFDLPKTNPAKRSAKRAPSARVGKTRKQYVSRPSQAPGHKAPSKRLQARRKKALNAPQGYFPNPLEAGVSSGKADQSKFPYHVQYMNQYSKWVSIGAFVNRADAFDYAKSAAKMDAELSFRVMKDE